MPISRYYPTDKYKSKVNSTAQSNTENDRSGLLIFGGFEMFDFGETCSPSVYDPVLFGICHVVLRLSVSTTPHSCNRDEREAICWDLESKFSG